MSFLRQHLLQPLQATGSKLMHDIGEVTHPLVHAVEQPVENVVRNTSQAVKGLWQFQMGLLSLLPYVVVGWMGWTFVGNYFPREKRILTEAVDATVKRIRYAR